MYTGPKEKMHALVEKVVRKKNVFLVVALWTAVIAIVVIKIFWIKYLTTARLAHRQDLYALYDAPAPQLLDVAILGAASLIVTFLMSTPKDLIYGFLASSFLSFFTAVIFVFLYFWSNPVYQSLFSVGLWDWEVVVYCAVLNVFRIMFPVVTASCLVGVLIGLLVRGYYPS